MKGLAAVGDVLAGKYRVDKILGIGGMGMVVAATHLELDQRVAIKFMLPGSADSPESAARFLREARAAGRLNSEHVCRVIDVGRLETGVPYIVMEYLQGENLGAVLRRRGPLRVSEAVDYILQGDRGPRRGPRARHRPSRSQAREPVPPQAQRRRHDGQGARLRDLEDRGGRAVDEDRRHHGLAGVHVARADGVEPQRRSARRHLVARRGPLPARRRQAAVPRPRRCRSCACTW